MAPVGIFGEIKTLSKGRPMLVTLSGGNPCMHSLLGQVIDAGHGAGYTFAVETQGTIAVPWLARCDYVILSPKPPSSGQPWTDTIKTKLARCVEVADHRHVVLKVPIFSSDDLAFAEYIGNLHPKLPLYLSVGNAHPPTDSAATEALRKADRGEADLLGLLAHYDWLCQMVLQRGLRAIVLPQLHVLTWGNRRGV